MLHILKITVAKHNTPGLGEIKLREEHDWKETCRIPLIPGSSNWYKGWQSESPVIASKFDREG